MISKSNLKHNKALTLVDTGGWGSDNSIVKDPPKSIHTRRKEKVFDTNKVMEEISQNRELIEENIQVYARGVNPFVSVNYSNSDGTGVKYQNTIMKDGFFRPKVYLPEELEALSRQRRPVFSQNSNVNDTTKYYNHNRVNQDFRKSRLIKNTLEGHIRPTATFKMSHQSMPYYDHRHKIRNALNTCANSGFSAYSDTITRNNQDPTSGVLGKLFYNIKVKQI